MRTFMAVLDKLFAVSFALLFAQFPEFFQQYLQRLQGHAAELRRLIAQWEQLAQKSHQSLTAYIQSFVEHADPTVGQHGLLLQQGVERLNQLSDYSIQLQQATAWSKPWLFFWNLQPDIAEATFAHFQPGVALTWEGLSYALVGALIGSGLCALSTKFCRSAL